MTTSQQHDDPRWDNRIPWYLRHSGVAVSGKRDSWLELIGHRIDDLLSWSRAFEVVIGESVAHSVRASFGT
jgi:hypothetical protein